MSHARTPRHTVRANVAAGLLLALAALGGCDGKPGPDAAGKDTPPTPAVVDAGQRIVDADAEPGNWLSHGRNYQETRHSPLRGITTANVARLGLAWHHDLDTKRGQEATPIVVDGRMYTTSAWSKVQAFDAVSGRLLWQYDPEVPPATAVKSCCDIVNRGVAWWNGTLFLGTYDGRLIALDAGTGTPRWSVMTVDPKDRHTITGAPRVVKGRVFIGNAGSELGARGYVSAYDAATGTLLWRFYTVPGDPAKPDGAASDAVLARLAADTWAREHWASSGGGGGTVWDSMAYDPDLDLLYIGVGNGSYWALGARSPKPEGNNDNLFIGSVLALRPETGEYVWHYQETPGDQWDYTSTQHMILADLTIGGQPRKVLLHAPKNGFFYVIDRATGELLSAAPYGVVNWASGIDMTTGRPIVNPEADYSRSGKTWLGMPGSCGAHDWQPMAFNPDTGLVYIPVIESGMAYLFDRDFKPLPLGINVGIDLGASSLPLEPEALAKLRATQKGALVAWDPVAQRKVWEVPMPGAWNGGVLSTAGGLVFEGDMDGRFSAFDARSGERLWSFDGQSTIIAPPVTWSHDGRQYVTVLTGWGGSYAFGSGPLTWRADNTPRVNRSRVLTFTLDATGALPPPVEPPPKPLQTPPQFADAATIEQGARVYNRTCFACHGFGGMSAGLVPDLRYSTAINSAAAWQAIVADGALTARGMVGFSANFSPEQLEAVRAYIIDLARKTAAVEARRREGAPAS